MQDCGRLEATGQALLSFTDLMGDMADDCARGYVLACNPANYVLMPIVGIIFAPFGIALGLLSDGAKNHYCGGGGRVGTRSPPSPERSAVEACA